MGAAAEFAHLAWGGAAKLINSKRVQSALDRFFLSPTGIAKIIPCITTVLAIALYICGGDKSPGGTTGLELPPPVSSCDMADDTPDISDAALEAIAYLLRAAKHKGIALTFEPDDVGWKVGYRYGMGGGDLASGYDLETAARAAERPLDDLAHTLGLNRIRPLLALSHCPKIEMAPILTEPHRLLKLTVRHCMRIGPEVCQRALGATKITKAFNSPHLEMQMAIPEMRLRAIPIARFSRNSELAPNARPYCPTRPSIHSRSRSACPQWRAYSSIR
jgi:hypothetical protein